MHSVIYQGEGVINSRPVHVWPNSAAADAYAVASWLCHVKLLKQADGGIEGHAAHGWQMGLSSE